MPAPQTPGPSSRAGRLTGQVIVLLEDDELIRRATERMLRRFGAEVVTGADSSEVLQEISNRNLKPSCVLADYWLGREESGLAAAAAVCAAGDGPVAGIIITGDLSDDVGAEVARAGFKLLRKPVNVESFLDAIIGGE